MQFRSEMGLWTRFSQNWYYDPNNNRIVTDNQNEAHNRKSYPRYPLYPVFGFLSDDYPTRRLN